ncbi:ATP-binding protein [Synechococcus sp. PCC 7336]|uniref:ATP-binding protein n=1 Tax=Synechococcus sp. PCC 7336 TaxID=195250 RepID=UPI00034BA473|nr:ATP-binding protein [Synechococcus sp. PCC 7336]
MTIWKKSLLAQLVAYFSLLSVVTICIVAGAAYQRARDSLLDSTRDRLRVAASLKQLQLGDWVDHQRKDVLLLGELDRMRSLVREMILNEPESEAYRGAALQLSRYFERVSQIKPNLNSLRVTSNGGFVVFASEASLQGARYQALGLPTTYFTAATVNSIVPNFYLNEGEAAITFATPVFDSQGEQMAAIAVDLDLAEVDTLIRERTGLWESAETYLVGRSGERFAFISRDDSEDRDAAAESVAEPVSPAIEAAIVGRGSGWGLYKNYQGVPVVGVYQWLDDQNVALLAEVSQHEAFAPARRLAREILQIGLSSAGLLLVGVYLLSRRITLPILAIARSANRLANGDLDCQVHELTQDEIGLLAKSFNRMSQQLRELVNNLELQVAERTQALEISKKEAEEARISAEAANAAKSSFLANMSHELRTPMNAIIGYSEMLIEEAEELEPEEFVPDLQKIRTSGKNLLELINGVLDLSKIEAGRMELYVESVDLYKLVQEACVPIYPLASKNDNVLEVECPEDIGMVRVDLTKVRQCLLNLLSNASKFTHAGQIVLSVKRIAVAGESDTIELQVRDSGIGMSPEQLDKVFDAFSQADASTTRKYGGTGLGLGIAKQFIEMMGGTISVTSEPGVGSTFTVRLPAEVDREPKAADRLSGSMANGLRPGEAPKVLVIHDRSEVGQELQEFLAKSGFQVEMAPPTQAALDRAREIKPDAITLDVLDSQMNSWDLLSAFKQDATLQAVAVILVSIQDLDQCGYAIGTTDYLTKPIDRKYLGSLLERQAENCDNQIVLVVEDDLDTRDTIVRLAEKYGWTAVEAAHGREALQQLRQTTPSLILTDIVMPEMNGFEFLNLLRANPDWRSIPVVAITSKELSNAERQQLQGQVQSAANATTCLVDGSFEQVKQQLLNVLSAPAKANTAPAKANTTSAKANTE